MMVDQAPHTPGTGGASSTAFGRVGTGQQEKGIICIDREGNLWLCDRCTAVASVTRYHM